MGSYLKTIGTGAICALAIAIAAVATSSSASARHLRAGGFHGHGGYWGGAIIGGFALGAKTYPYYGYVARYEVGYSGPIAPVIRARY